MAKINTLQSNTHLVIIFIGLFAAIFLGTLYIGMQIYLSSDEINDSIQVEEDSNLVNDVILQNATDPLITFVPEDQRSASAKNNIFVSTLDPILGLDTANVYVIFYGSVLDASIQAALANVPTWSQVYGDQVSFVWKDYVDVNNQDALDVAETMHCLNEIGEFWNVAPALNEYKPTSSDAFAAMLDSLGVSALRYAECKEASGYASLVYSSTQAASYSGVGGASLYINDIQVNMEDGEAIESTIDEVLKSFADNS